MPEWNPLNYDAWYSTPLGKASHMLERGLILSMADAKKEQVVLDAGSGTGIYSIELAGRYAGVIALDGSLEMLKHARAKASAQGITNIQFACGGALNLPFPDNHFDAVFSVCMLCFIRDGDKAILEMKRVLKPGGRLVMGVLNKWSPWAVLRRLKGLFAETIYGNAVFISPPELKGMLEETGLGDIRLRSCLFFLPLDLGLYLGFSGMHEAIGKTLAPNAGAFLAASAKKL